MTNKDIYNLRKEYQSFALNVQDEFLSSPSNTKFKVRYNIISKIYRKLITKNSDFSIKEYMYSLLSEVNKYESEYDYLYKEYEKGNHDVKDALNHVAYHINSYNESINIINSHLMKKYEEVKDEREKWNDNKPEEINYSDNIIYFIRKYNVLNNNSEEAKLILKQIYDLREKRKENYINLIGTDAITLLSEIDSLEMMIADSNDHKIESYEVDAEGYSNSLRDALNGINEYYFTDYLSNHRYYKSKKDLSNKKNQDRFDRIYSQFLKRYKNLISSLYKTESFDFKVDGNSVNTTDLMAYLRIYNLDEGYSVFKEKNNKTMIGASKLDRKDYEKSVEFINRSIDELCNLSEKKIGDKTITISDNTLGTTELKELRQQKFNEIGFMINRGIVNER